MKQYLKGGDMTNNRVVALKVVPRTTLERTKAKQKVITLFSDIVIIIAEK